MKYALAPLMRDLAAECGSFYSWWLHEIIDLWDALISKVAPGRANRAVIQLRRDGATLRFAKRGESENTTDVSSTSSDAPLGEILPQLLGVLPRGAAVRVCLDETRVLVRELAVPAVVERGLDRVVALQLERQLPIPLEQVYCDWRAEQRTPSRNQLRVAIAAARREEVDAIRNGLQAHGWRAVGIGLAGNAGSPLRFDFLQRRGRIASGAVLSRSDRMLVGSAVVLLFGLAGLLLGQSLYEQSRLATIAAEERVRAAHASEYRDQLQQVSVPFNALRDLVQHPTSADVLLTLTSTVPQDSWVYQLEVSSASADRGAGAVKLSALTPTATLLVDVLEKASGVDQVRMIAATSAGIGTGMDRVELSLHAASGSPAATIGAQP